MATEHEVNEAFVARIRRNLRIQASGECVFCQIVAGKAPATIVHRWDGAIAIVPLNPVTDGHLLVIPTRHVADFTEEPIVTGEVMEFAAMLAKPPANLITSAGAEASQTEKHFHVHVVPRRAGDGLALPWTGRERLGGGS